MVVLRGCVRYKSNMNDRSVLITGASSGIGRACALHLGRTGYRVFAGVRSIQDANSLREEASGNITPVLLDVTDNEAITAAVEGVAEATGGSLYGLINNAGVGLGGPLELLPDNRTGHLLNVNVLGVVAVTRAFLPLIRNNRGGRIIMISSISGRIALPGLSVYAASKFALEALSDALRVELKPFNIDVVLIEPGNVATPIWEKSIADNDAVMAQADAAVKKLYANLIQVLNRIAQNPRGIKPEHVANIVAHALVVKRPRSRYMVGKGIWMMWLLSRLPDSLRDWIILRNIK
jgi:NAD(P)-dependent dehydrogenase (short-subunit alcohol dehydrogenase family)